MKKLISLLLVLSIVLSFPVTAMAATPSVDKTTVEAGEEITVTISLDQAYEDIATWDLHLYFDPTLFELVGTEIAEGQRSSIVLSNLFNDETGTYYKFNDIDPMFAGFDMPAGDLYYFTFKALEDITADATAQFELVSGAWMDVYFNEFEDPITNGTISVNVTVPVEPEGYTVALSPETQTKVTGETAQVKIDVTNSEATAFNSFDMVLSYDPAQLTLATSSLGDDKYTITDNNGTVRIQGYGQDVAVGTAFTLDFTVGNLTDDAVVTLISAKVDSKDNAVADAPEATLGNTVATIKLGAYTVTLPDDFIGEDTVAPGDDYTFEATDKNYDYVVEATMGGEAVTVIDNGDGTYTIENVTGDIVVTATKTPKSFGVTVDGTGKDDVVAGNSATYLTDYVFTLNKADGYTYELSMTIGGVAYSGYQVNGTTYTVPGADITGEIVISVEKTTLAADRVSVNFDGTGAGDVTGESSAVKNQDYTFTVNQEEGYAYEILVTVGGTEVAVIDNGNGTYTIPGASVTDTITITVNKVSDVLAVEVSEYVKLDGKAIYLVTAQKETLAEGKAYAYNGTTMYWSDAYNAYAYLVISDVELTVEAASALVTEVTATADTVSYTGDINGTTVIDINDAQLVYNMYKAEYETFETATMAMFLRADMNGDKTLTVGDSAAVVNLIA